jgi:hypothetical protein
VEEEGRPTLGESPHHSKMKVQIIIIMEQGPLVGAEKLLRKVTTSCHHQGKMFGIIVELERLHISMEEDSHGIIIWIVPATGELIIGMGMELNIRIGINAPSSRVTNLMWKILL